MKKEFQSFEDAREFVHSLGIKNQKSWATYYKSGNKPEDIPTTPARSYKKEWKSWGDWLGTGTVQTQQRNYLSYQESKNIVHSLGLKTREDWNDAVKTGKIPNNIPHNSWHVYSKEKKK